MRIGLCQIDSQWEDRDATKKRIAELIEEWNGSTDCLIFPEMTLSGFSMCQNCTTLSPDDHEFFANLAVRVGATLLYGGVENKMNTLFIARPGSESVALYRKRHLFSYGGESESYVSGNETAIVELSGIRFALGICYDLRFAYHFWQQAPFCDGYIVIANWPEGRRVHWTALLRARAIENQAFIVGVNRVGKDPRLSYSGNSAVFGPLGEALLDCDGVEGIHLCDIEAAHTIDVRNRYEFMKDRQE